MLALELAMGLLFRLGFLQRGKLGLGQHQALLSALGFQCLETLVHVLKVMPEPDAAYAGGRDRKPPFPELIGDAQLTEGGLLDGKHDDGVLDLLWDAILQNRLLVFKTGFLRLISCNASSPPFS